MRTVIRSPAEMPLNFMGSGSSYDHLFYLIGPARNDLTGNCTIAMLQPSKKPT